MDNKRIDSCRLWQLLAAHIYKEQKIQPVKTLLFILYWTMIMHINAQILEERGVGVGARAAEGLANDGVDPDYRDKRNLQ